MSLKAKQILAARKALAASKKWGSAVEAGIRSGAWDHGEAIKPFVKQVEGRDD